MKKILVALLLRVYKPIIYLYPETELATPEWVGFVAVEWGGTEVR